MRRGDWMETFTGLKFWPIDPREDEVCIEDIAHALSLICRFGGQCKEFYSVAQHSCHVADIVSATESNDLRHLTFTALMHDAAEAYVGDIIRPIKRSNPEIAKAESAVEIVIACKFGLLIHPMPKIIKWADNVMLKNEHAQLMNGRNEWPSCDQEDGPFVSITPWGPNKARLEFMQRFKRWSL